MAPKRAPIEASSNASKGKRPEEARMIATKGKRSEVAKTSTDKHKTLEVAKSNANKGKKVAMDENVEIRKKTTFDRTTFIIPKRAQRFNLHFANRTVIPGRNIDFSKLNYFQFDRLLIRWVDYLLCL